MPGFSISSDDSAAKAYLQSIGPNVRQALIAALAPIAASIEDDARSRAAAHIHLLGSEPGVYLGSIRAGVIARDESSVTIFAGSSSYLASWLEDGVSIPAHDILPGAAEALYFTGSAGEVFAKYVRSPGADIPAYPAIRPAFEAKRGEIMDAFASVALNAGDL